MMADQPTLPGIVRTLDQEVETSIKTLRLYEDTALQLSEDGYYGCFSGGKDSIVVKRLAELAGVRISWHYSVPTIDPPELVHFIRREHPDVEWHRPEHSLWWMAANAKGLPTRRMRWCCALYKETGGLGRVKVTGIRAAESPRRAARWKVCTPWKGRGETGWVVNPILYWTDERVWEFIHREALPYCELYDEGFKRLGCVGCPMSYRRADELKRWPGYERQWRRAARLYWERQVREGKTGGKHHRTFDNADQWFDWWLSNESMPDDVGDDEPCLGLVM